MNPLQIGPVVMNENLLVFFVSALTGYMALRIRLIRTNVDYGVVKEKFLNAMFLSFFIWKFSVIAFDPVSVIEDPLSLIYFHGGEKGIWLAGTISAVYLWISMKKTGLPVGDIVELVTLVFLSGFGAYHGLIWLIEAGQWIFHVVSATISVLLSGWILKRKKMGDANIQILLWFSLGQIFSAFLDGNRSLVFLGFSAEQLAFIGLSLLLVGWAHLAERK